MAHLAEDICAGLEASPQRYPIPGERWRHYKEGKVVEVLFLEFARRKYDENSRFSPYPLEILPQSLQNDWAQILSPLCACEILSCKQCVVYVCGDKLYVRTVENFLERFDDGVYRFERV